MAVELPKSHGTKPEKVEVAGGIVGESPCWRLRLDHPRDVRHWFVRFRWLQGITQDVEVD